MFEWAWSYFTYTRSARLITGESNIVPMATLQHMEEASEHVAQMEAKERLVASASDEHNTITRTEAQASTAAKRTA